MAIRPRTRVLMSVLLGATTLAGAPVWAQTAPAQGGVAEQETQVDEIVVTNSLPLRRLTSMRITMDFILSSMFRAEIRKILKLSWKRVC